MQPDTAFWRGRRVLLTGHTGFKGAWLTLWLARLGACVTGLALPPQTKPNLWELLKGNLTYNEIVADIRDEKAVRAAVRESDPSVVIHMAAQALVPRSYENPVETFAVNLLGTVHLMDALRECEGLEATLVVTTDKVYANDETGKAFSESDRLGGHDPYSASKVCAEIAVESYARSFFRTNEARLATARAGNVIGGGDWSRDRLVPDVWRAWQSGEPIVLRNPMSRRPWQHVLEPIAGYILYVQALARRETVPTSLNFGPTSEDSATVDTVAKIMAQSLGLTGDWVQCHCPKYQEMALLALDPSLAIKSLGWLPRLSCEEAIRWSADWYVQWSAGRDPITLCDRQISDYLALL